MNMFNLYNIVTLFFITFFILITSSFTWGQIKDFEVIAIDSLTGLKQVKKLDKLGIIDKEDNILLEPIYDDLKVYSERGAIRFKIGKLYGVINLEGKLIIPCKYGWVNVLSKNKFEVEDNTTEKWGILNDTMGIILPIEFDHITRIPEGKGFWVKKEGNYGLYSKDGDIIIPPVYDKVKAPGFFMEGHLLRREGKWGFWDEKWKQIVPAEYDTIEVEFLTMGVKVLSGGKWGYYNSAGEKIISTQYDEVEPTLMVDGGAVVRNKDKRGYFNSKGELIVPIIYDEVRVWKRENTIIVRLNEKEGLLNKDGKIVLPIEYEALNLYPIGYIKAVKNKKIGFYHFLGKVLVEPIYDEFELLNNGKFNLLKDDDWEEIDVVAKMKTINY